MHGQKGSGLFEGMSAAVPAAPQPPVRKTNAENRPPDVQRTTTQQKLEEEIYRKRAKHGARGDRTRSQKATRLATCEQARPQQSEMLRHSAVRAKCGARDGEGPKYSATQRGMRDKGGASDTWQTSHVHRLSPPLAKGFKILPYCVP